MHKEDSRKGLTLGDPSSSPHFRKAPFPGLSCSSPGAVPEPG